MRDPRALFSSAAAGRSLHLSVRCGMVLNDKWYTVLWAVGFSLLFLCLSVPAVNAEEGGRVFARPCNTYSTSKDFIRRASAFCLTQPRQRQCERRSADYFAQCGFSGNFKELSRAANTDLLLMFVFAKVPDIAHRSRQADSAIAIR